jgi:hypothetical protein
MWHDIRVSMTRDTSIVDESMNELDARSETQYQQHPVVKAMLLMIRFCSVYLNTHVVCVCVFVFALTVWRLTRMYLNTQHLTRSDDQVAVNVLKVIDCKAEDRIRDLRLALLGIHAPFRRRSIHSLGDLVEEIELCRRACNR